MLKQDNLKRNKFANNGTLSANRRLNQLRYDAKSKYGLTLELARELRNKPCQICGKLSKKMVIDHVTKGTYRGILCQQCNTRLGWLEKRKKEIEQYLN